MGNVSYGGTGFFYDRAPSLPEEVEHCMPDYHLYDGWVQGRLDAGAKRSDFQFYLDYVTYELNDSEILAHRPVETWGSGRHILSLYYPIDSLVPNVANTFNVYLRMEGGTGEIETGGCIASISGQGMAAAAAWDGTVTVEESVGRFALGGGLGMKVFAGDMGIETMELVQRSYGDSMGKVLIETIPNPQQSWGESCTQVAMNEVP